jgi:integrase
MQPLQVPDLSATSGTPGTRRDYFTPDEVRTISDAFPSWIEDSVTQRSKDIRQLLYYYFHVAVYTGMRPGTEMDNLKWSDLVIRKKGEEIPHILITVRKGKTTLHTGTRVVMAYNKLMEMILDMHGHSMDGEDEEVPDDWDPLLFRLPDGSTTDQLGRNFTALLKRLKLEKGPGGKRTMYSLRHTYITMQLMEKVSPEVIAHQCGTSAEMIRLHYNHLTSQVFKKELIGNPDSPLTKLVRQYANLL